jgi:hypothetical protein
LPGALRPSGNCHPTFGGTFLAYFAGFFGVLGVFDAFFVLIVFPGGTHPHPQFSFLAIGITSFRPFP